MREVRDKNGSLIASYLYDADNRRVRKDMASGADIDYQYKGWQVLEERDPAASPSYPKQQYVYGIFIDEPLILDINEDNDEYTTEGVDSRCFFHQNTLYSMYGLSDDNGNILEAYEYDPYGKHWVIYNNGSALNFDANDTRTTQGLSNYGNPYLFTGRRWDAESKLQYSRHRYYSTNLGRFISRDPIGYEGGINQYEYTQSAATIAIDPYGEEVRWEVKHTRKEIGDIYKRGLWGIRNKYHRTQMKSRFTAIFDGVKTESEWVHTLTFKLDIQLIKGEKSIKDSTINSYALAWETAAENAFNQGGKWELVARYPGNPGLKNKCGSKQMKINFDINFITNTTISEHREVKIWQDMPFGTFPNVTGGSDASNWELIDPRFSKSPYLGVVHEIGHMYGLVDEIS